MVILPHIKKIYKFKKKNNFIQEKKDLIFFLLQNF